MTTPKFPLVEALGASVYTNARWNGCDGKGWCDSVVRAAELERILAQAPVVRGSLQEDAWTWDEPRKWHEEKDIPATHTARLLCVRPIVRDTAESLLREYLQHSSANRPIPPDVDRRTRKLLSKGGG